MGRKFHRLFVLFKLVASHIIRIWNKNSDLKCCQESSGTLILKTVSIYARHVLYIRILLRTLQAGIQNTNPLITNLARLIRKYLDSFIRVSTVYLYVWLGFSLCLVLLGISCLAFLLFTEDSMQRKICKLVAFNSYLSVAEMTKYKNIYSSSSILIIWAKLLGLVSSGCHLFFIARCFSQLCQKTKLKHKANFMKTCPKKQYVEGKSHSA